MILWDAKVDTQSFDYYSIMNMKDCDISDNTMGIPKGKSSQYCKKFHTKATLSISKVICPSTKHKIAINIENKKCVQKFCVMEYKNYKKSANCIMSGHICYVLKCSKHDKVTGIVKSRAKVLHLIKLGTHVYLIHKFCLMKEDKNFRKQLQCESKYMFYATKEILVFSTYKRD